MKIYNYHPATGEYISTSDADKSPLEKDVYLVPANATDIAPPNVIENQVACFKDGAWALLDDFRGVEYWLEDGSKKTISEIGEVVPENGSLTAVEPEKDYKLLITNEVERRIFAHASANTQMNMTGAATAGLLTTTQMEAYKQGLLWVSSMRSKGAELIASKTTDYSSDSHWPKPSTAAVALAEMF